MSKYITHFQTEAAYQAALPTLDLPNVSLVDEFNEVHYHRALYNAHAGDICLYDVAEGQKIFVASADWNLTDYPTASYPIVGIAIADESAVGLTVMSNFGIAADGSKTTSNVQLKWQNTNFDWGLTKYTTENLAKTDFNGKTNTATIIAAIKAYDTSHSTDNLTGNISGAIQAFVTEGTVAGDWYIGGGGEIYKMYENMSTIKATANKIYSAGSTLGMNGNTLIESNYYWSSTEYGYNAAHYVNMGGGSVSFTGKDYPGGYIRAFLRV